MFKDVIDSGKIIENVPMQGMAILDYELAKDYAKVERIDREVDEEKKEIDLLNNLKENPKTTKEIRDEFKICLEGYVAKAEEHLKSVIEGRQTGMTSPFFVRIDDVVEALQKVLDWKSLLKQGYLIEATNVEGISQEARESKIKDHREKIESLNKKRVKFFPKGQTEWYRKIRGQIETWKVSVKYFGNATDVNGIYLSEKREEDKKWLEIYHLLEIEKIPRYKLLVPLMIGEKEFIYHPGHKFDGK